MRLLLLLLMVRCCVGVEWEQLDELEMTFREYSMAAKRIISSTERSISNIRSQAKEFVEGLFHRFSSEKSSSNTEDKCSLQYFNFEELKTSFQGHLSRSEVALISHVIELKERLEVINSTISIYQDFADSKYWSCKVHNVTCIDEINSWLEEVIPTIACKLSNHCKVRQRTKRLIRKRRCSQSEYTCEDGGCIQKKWACDGEYDCKDESDEPHGCVKECANGFHCNRTLHCIDKSRVCNGVDDCGDNSDEKNCKEVERKRSSNKTEQVNCTIEMGLHRCDGNNCIGLEQVCDNSPDCRDGSDEGMLCGKGECPAECRKSGGICFHGPLGPLCFTECPLGTVESSDGCTSRPQHHKKAVTELLEEILFLTTRHSARFSSLKVRTTSEVSKVLAEMMRCDQKRLIGFK